MNTITIKKKSFNIKEIEDVLIIDTFYIKEILEHLNNKNLLKKQDNEQFEVTYETIEYLSQKKDQNIAHLISFIGLLLSMTLILLNITKCLPKQEIWLNIGILIGICIIIKEYTSNKTEKGFFQKIYFWFKKRLKQFLAFLLNKLD